MSSDEEEESGDEEQQPAEELEPTQEFHDQDDGNATPPYGVGGDDGGETEPDDDGEETEADDDEPEPAVDTAAEHTELLVNISAWLLGDKFDDTMKTWLPETWLADDVKDVYELRSALRGAGDNGPLPAATRAVLDELQPEDFVVAKTRVDGFLSKYLQTDLTHGTMLLASMLGLDPDYASPAGSDAWCPPLLRRWVRAADAFKQSDGRGRAAAAAKKRARPPTTPRASSSQQGGSSSASDAALPSSATRQAQRQRAAPGLGPSRAAASKPKPAPKPRPAAKPAAKPAASSARRGAAAARAAAAAAADDDDADDDEGTEAEEEEEEEEVEGVKDDSCSDSDEAIEVD